MTIILINGFPGAGKDEFVKQCQIINPEIFNISTVDFIKQIATECGWDGTKTAENRKFLSDLKDLLTQWADVPFRRVEHELILYARRMESRDVPEYDQIAFVHCREPQEIAKFVERLGAQTLLIIRPNTTGQGQCNHADTHINDYHYDYTIHNNGTIADLAVTAAEFLNIISPKNK